MSFTRWMLPGEGLSVNWLCRDRGHGILSKFQFKFRVGRGRVLG